MTNICPLCKLEQLWFTHHDNDPAICMREQTARVRNLTRNAGAQDGNDPHQDFGALADYYDQLQREKDGAQ